MRIKIKCAHFFRLKQQRRIVVSLIQRKNKNCIKKCLNFRWSKKKNNWNLEFFFVFSKQIEKIIRKPLKWDKFFIDSLCFGIWAKVEGFERPRKESHLYRDMHKCKDRCRKDRVQSLCISTRGSRSSMLQMGESQRWKFQQGFSRMVR